MKSETLLPCPICGSKVFIMHDVVPGAGDFGFGVGCPRFCRNDGIHGMDNMPDEEFERKRLTGFYYPSKKMAIKAWNERVLTGEWRTGPWDLRPNRKVKLLPCPFCGGEANGPTDAWPHMIVCGGCGASVKGFAMVEDGKREAIEKWNRRAHETD